MDTDVAHERPWGRCLGASFLGVLGLGRHEHADGVGIIVRLRIKGPSYLVRQRGHVCYPVAAHLLEQFGKAQLCALTECVGCRKAGFLCDSPLFIQKLRRQGERVYDARRSRIMDRAGRRQALGSAEDWTGRPMRAHIELMAPICDGVVDTAHTLRFRQRPTAHKQSRASAAPVASSNTSRTDATREGTKAWWISSVAA